MSLAEDAFDDAHILELAKNNIAASYNEDFIVEMSHIYLGDLQLLFGELAWFRAEFITTLAQNGRTIGRERETRERETVREVEEGNAYQPDIHTAV